ncbi:TetR/AcrR family transcriptional regulator [Rathayibacter sp. Leaf296]|uniref:TetR/AcrR family transcriptional regulator n=1 Tax=Rathayibacter sp. Leaf296 TaxID=1736327 RepID=UPI000B1E5255|nr:TetR/AcrR family transcriptional regulator [Rathayibacter sp. Leaf296]
MEERVDGRSLRYAHRREELLAAATEHVLEHGLTGLSLRRIAVSAGVSHATLEHHFASRDRLIAEIVDRVLAVMFADPEVSHGGSDPLRAIWASATSEHGRRHVRLFLAITGQSMHEEPVFASAVARSVRTRVELLAAALEQDGRSRSEALAVATLILGVMRGLLADLLLTGDEERVDAAFDVFATGVTGRDGGA